MTHHVHDMPFGAALRPGGGARFRLWAPAAARVALTTWHGNERVRHDGTVGPDGWCEVDVADARAGDRYHWTVTVGTPSGEVAVPDPAARHSPEGPFAPSVLLDPQAFDWQDDGWTGRPWHEAVVCEVHVGTFTDAGTFDAAAARLPALAALGITCIQLMPLATAPGRFGWGYDGVLPFAPQASLGSPDDLKRFVQTAHGLGLMVMLDVVYNHFGPSGNFLPLYAPDFFSDRHHNAWGDALNFDGPGSANVREFFIHNAVYWVDEYRFDGLRLDAVHAMQDDSTPHILEALSARVRAATAGRHVHLVLENDVNDAARLAEPGRSGRYDAQWSGDFHHALHVLLTREHEGYYGEYAGDPMAHLARTLTQGFSREGEPHLGAADRLAANPRRDATSTVTLPATVNFLQNHDQIGNRAFGDRLVTLVDEAPLRLATALLLLSPPVPMLMMGEAWGAETPFLYFADWNGELRDAVVAGRRREFAHFSAFADAQARERIPDPCSAQTFARCRLQWDGFDTAPRSVRWHEFHQRLLALRHRDLVPRLPQLATGHHRAEVHGTTLLAVDWRFGDGVTLSVRANLGTEAVKLPDAATTSNAPGADWATVGTVDGHTLGPWSGRWWWHGEGVA